MLNIIADRLPKQPVLWFQDFLRGQSFLKYNVLALVLSNLAAVLNYATSIYLARSLTVEGYGLYYALQASSPVFFSMVAFIPCSILNAVATYRQEHSKMQQVLSNLLVIYSIFAVVLVGSLFVMIDFFMEFLKVTDLGLMSIFAVTWIPILALSVLQGVVQGHLLFKELTLKDALLALSKITIMIVLISGFGLGYMGAAFAECFATAGIAIWMYLAIRDRIELPKWSRQPILWSALRPIWKMSFLPAMNMSLMGFLMMVDLVAVKHFFSDYESGLYTAGATLGRIPFIFSGVLVTLLFPQIAHDGKDTSSALKNLGITASIVGLSALFFSGLIAWQGQNLLYTLFGHTFLHAETAMFWVLMSSSLLAMVNVLFNYMLAKRWWTFLVPSMACVGGCFYYMSNNPPVESFEIPRTLSLMLGGLLMIGFAFMVFYHRKESQRSQ